MEVQSDKMKGNWNCHLTSC